MDMMIVASHTCTGSEPNYICATRGHGEAPAPTDYTGAIILAAVILAVAAVLVALVLRRAR